MTTMMMVATVMTIAITIMMTVTDAYSADGKDDDGSRGRSDSR